MTPRWIITGGIVVGLLVLWRFGRPSAPLILLELLVVIWTAVAVGVALQAFSQGTLNWLLIGTFASVLVMAMFGAIYRGANAHPLKPNGPMPGKSTATNPNR